MRILGFIFIILCGFLFACKVDNNNQNNILNIRVSQEPERLNPLLLPSPSAREIYQYIFLPLADYNSQTLKFEPILVK